MKMAVFYYLFVCCTVFLLVEADKVPDNVKVSKACVCPPEPELDLEPCVLRSNRRKFGESLWKRLPVEVATGGKFREIVTKMMNSDSSVWNHAAFVNNVWLYNHLPYVSQTPSVCPFAQLINATVIWDTSKDFNYLSKALDQYAATTVDYVRATVDNALSATGCGSPAIENVRLSHDTCDQGGLVYKIDEIWKLCGDLMPRAYERAAKTLYNSKSYLDRLMAVMASVSLTPILQFVSDNYDHQLVFKYIQLTTASPIPSCCCPAYIASTQNIYDMYAKESARIVNQLKDMYKAGWTTYEPEMTR